MDTQRFFVQHQLGSFAIDVYPCLFKVGVVLSEQLLEVMNHFLALHCGVI